MILILASLTFFSACRPKNDTASIDLHIAYSVNGKELQCDTLSYVNEAGNHFMINEIQWFISKLELQDEQDEWFAFGEGDNIYYIDTDLPASHLIHSTSLPVGRYKALRFVFGLDEEDNRTGRFPNPPESNMFWPEPLGGGYHYMKLNCKWLTPDDVLAPVNVHLGTGQNSDLTVFYPNHFSVTLPIDFTVKASANAATSLELTMTIDNWFRNPHTYDFNTFGGAIMQNQNAQQVLKENGHDVFSLSLSNSTMEKTARAVQELFRKASPQPHFFTKENMGKLLSDFKEKRQKP